MLVFLKQSRVTFLIPLIDCLKTLICTAQPPFTFYATMAYLAQEIQLQFQKIVKEVELIKTYVHFKVILCEQNFLSTPTNRIFIKTKV